MANKPKVLVLGSTGMLGSMVRDAFKIDSRFEVSLTSRHPKNNELAFDSIEFLSQPEKYNFLKGADYIINCIGIIKPYCKDNDPKGVHNAIQVNALFPHRLAQFLKESKTKIIQIATDCVYSGKKGQYIETDLHDALDVYGKTKSLGEVASPKLLNIRCSIIGPEEKGKLSLLEWFLSQKNGSSANGFNNHLWNGITTLQFADICKLIISNNKFEELRNISHLHHFIPNSTVNKFELLKIFNSVYGKGLQINETKASEAVDRTLSSKFKSLSSIYPSKEMHVAIKELYEFTQKHYGK